MTFRVVSLHGFAGSGKDAIADALVENHGFVKLSWAAPLKKCVADVLGLTPNELEDIKTNQFHPKSAALRRVLQRVGTDVFRKEWDENVWVDAGLRALDRARAAGGPGAVFADTRFPNELLAVRNQPGYFTARISAPEKYRRAPADHPTETALEGAYSDIVVWNDRSTTPGYHADRLIWVMENTRREY